ncbi:hypothetical protein CWI37_0416p0010 [Hamiltosporidium tvaerminnensis]|uniref:Uncharacterized protein n=1 Tax=Hamiltosporidium tvaerminnensis TaxID=1176355 RepID=A0A4Q9L5C5_9MICR|nr:hypothetical protein CWI37_0416p0010 [Hamiltosporidium tvaerminnensis]
MVFAGLYADESGQEDGSNQKNDDHIKMRDSEHVEMEFGQLELQRFWYAWLERYPWLRKKAPRSFLHFPST